MLGTLVKLALYAWRPRTMFSIRHPSTAARLLITPVEMRKGYAPRIAVLTTAAIVAPLAYRLGRRAGEGTLLVPRRP